MVRMSKLYEVVHSTLAKGPRATEELIAECRRLGLPYRTETVRLFLQLSREIEQRDGFWSHRGKTKQVRIVDALQEAFASGATYLPTEKLSEFLDKDENVTPADIAAVCEENGQYRMQGRFILRT
jgi:hypothetical protein